MKPAGDAVFVYGLLMFPEVVFAITGQHYQMQPAILPDHKRFGLSKQPGDTPVPALTQCAGYIQQGKILLGVMPEELSKLDFFEELDSGLYLRNPVRVQSEGQWLNAWCYMAGPALAPYLSGDWSIEQVNQTHIEQLINTLIPSMLTTYHKLRT